MPTFVLVHSPLTGPFVWSGVAGALRRRRYRVVVPDIRALEANGPPYRQRHVDAVLAALKTASAESPLILAGHSGGGVLLPAIAAASRRPVAAFLFVDANLPEDGKSRLQLFDTPEEVAQFRQAAVDGLLPVWSDEDLREAIPDDDLRARYVAELRPSPLAIYEEPIPVPAGWDDAACGYLHFSEPYLQSAAQAREAGWECLGVPGSHFALLTNPGSVTAALLLLCARLGVDLASP